MEIVISRIEKDMIFIEDEKGRTFGVPRDIFPNASIGDVFVIKKITFIHNDTNRLNID